MKKKSHITVRLLHCSLTVFVLIILFTKDTELKRNLYSGHLYYVSTYLLVVALSFVFYFLTSCIDPGYVHVGTFHPEANNLNTDEEEVKILINFPQENTEENQQTSSDVDAKQIRNRHCGFCAIVQPLRAKHCEECMRCVHRYDHHCPWIGNCVGEKNHRYFLMFLFLETVLISWSIYTCVKAFHTEYFWKNWFKQNWMFLLLTIFLFVCVMVVGLLWICHSYMMLTAQTTWEFMSRPRISYLKKLPIESNPFDQGYFRNIVSFLFYCNIQKWDDLYKKSAN